MLVLKLIRLNMNYDTVNLSSGEYGELLKGYTIYAEFITPAPDTIFVISVYLSPLP